VLAIGSVRTPTLQKAPPPLAAESRHEDFLSDLLLDPGGSSCPHQDGQSNIAFQLSDTVGPTGSYFRGSITRPTYLLSTLSVVGHPTPPKTRFPPAGQALTGRELHPLGSNPDFQGDIRFSSPFRPSLSWRTGKVTKTGQCNHGLLYPFLQSLPRYNDWRGAPMSVSENGPCVNVRRVPGFLESSSRPGGTMQPHGPISGARPPACRGCGTARPKGCASGAWCRSGPPRPRRQARFSSRRRVRAHSAPRPHTARRPWPTDAYPARLGAWWPATPETAARLRRRWPTDHQPQARCGPEPRQLRYSETRRAAETKRDDVVPHRHQGT
jgi:hypothetical protein